MITVIGTPHYLDYCEIFTAYAQFTIVAAGRIIQPGGYGLNTHELNKYWPTWSPSHRDVSV